MVFQYIFPFLPIQTLFALRQVSHVWHQVVRYYFSYTRCLDISHISIKLTAKAFDILTEENTNLVYINFANAKNVLTDKLLMPVFKNNPRLQSVDLTNCISLSNSSVQVLVSQCTDLRNLTLRDCVWLSPEGVSVIGLHCQELQTIDLSGCWNVNDEALIVLVKGCPK